MSKTEKPNPSPVGRVLNLTQVAERIGKHRNTIRRWIDDGLLPAVINPSGLIGIREEVLDEFYTNNKFLPREEIFERLDFNTTD